MTIEWIDNDIRVGLKTADEDHNKIILYGAQIEGFLDDGSVLIDSESVEKQYEEGFYEHYEWEEMDEEERVKEKLEGILEKYGTEVERYG